MAGLRRITPRGAEDDLQLLSARIDYSMNEQDSARVYTSQPLETLAGESISLSESDDEIKVSQGGSDIFGGILRDIMRTGTRIELLVDSYARTARDEKPSGALNEVTQDDTTIVQNAIDDVPELTAGTLEGVRNNLEFTFHHASPALRIKLVEQATGHEARYNADKTVDFLAQLGSDKTGTTLSPTNQQLVESIRVDHNAGDVVANHLRVIGADGSAVDVEAEGFNTNAEREKWRRAYFQDTSADATLTARGETLLEQLGNPWTKIQATLTNPPGGSIDPQLGDTFNVSIPDKNVDDDLRITRLTHVIDSDGEEWEATLSNRSRELGHELEKLSTSARDNAAGGRGMGFFQASTSNITRDSDTSDISLAANTLHRVENNTGSAIDALLPDSPANKTQVAIVLLDSGSNGLVVKPSGSDVIDGGETSRGLGVSGNGESIIYTYDATNADWYALQ